MVNAPLLHPCWIPGSEFTPLSDVVSKRHVKHKYELIKNSPNVCPLPSFTIEANLSPLSFPFILKFDSHVGEACLSDCWGNGLYGSQHGVDQLRQLPGSPFNSSSFFHNISGEGEHICFEGASVRHFCWQIKLYLLRTTSFLAVLWSSVAILF